MKILNMFILKIMIGSYKIMWDNEIKDDNYELRISEYEIK